jgi:hypothetical protein
MIPKRGIALGQLVLAFSMAAAQADEIAPANSITVAQGRNSESSQFVARSQPPAGAPEIRPLFVAPHSDQQQSLENFSMPTGDSFGPSPVDVYSRADRSPTTP